MTGISREEWERKQAEAKAKNEEEYLRTMEVIREGTKKLTEYGQGIEIPYIDIQHVDYALNMLAEGAQLREAFTRGHAILVFENMMRGSIAIETAVAMEHNGLITSQENPDDDDLEPAATRLQ